MSENEALQNEQNRLIEIQAKLLNEGKKREQDMRKQVDTVGFSHKTKNSFLLASNRNSEKRKSVFTADSRTSRYNQKSFDTKRNNNKSF